MMETMKADTMVYGEAGGGTASCRPGDVIGRHELEAGGVVSVAIREPLVVGVGCGRVWITQTGCSADVVVDAGGYFLPYGRGKVVVQALERTSLCVIRA